MPHPTTVSLVRCQDYDLAQVEAAIRRSVELLGGMSAFVKPGQRVLLKPNLLRPTPPERACTTHPTVVASVAKLVIEAGARPVIIESPGGPYVEAVLRLNYRRTGMAWAAEVSGAELNYDTATVQVSHPEGVTLHRLDVLKPVAEADALINLAKLKTHNLSGLTVCVKNLFGIVPGVLKFSYHAKLRDAWRLCEGLVDIATFAKPVLNIVDAVVAMEGNGPSGGDPRRVGAILAGVNPFDVDVAAAALVNFDPALFVTTQVAVQRGLTTGRAEDLTWLGDPLDELRVSDFRKGAVAAVDPGIVPRKLLGLVTIGRPAPRSVGETPKGLSRYMLMYGGWFMRQLVILPHAGPKCIGCGVCVRSCPVGAITLVNKVAYMDPRKCIRCYCCHELCPEEAVVLERPWLGRLLLRR